MKVDILNVNGKTTGKSVDLPDDVFNIEPNEHAVYLAVKSYLANQRQGTHKSKERGEIVGSTRKIKRQKGTGSARAGSIKNPMFRGGGRMFGPRPRTYTVRLNKKVSRLARQSAYAMKLQGGNLKVVEDFTFEAPQTKQYLNFLGNVEASGQKSLFILSDYDKNVYLSSRNVPKAEVKHISEVSTYDILHANQVILSENAVDSLKKSMA